MTHLFQEVGDGKIVSEAHRAALSKGMTPVGLILKANPGLKKNLKHRLSFLKMDPSCSLLNCEPHHLSFLLQ